MDTQKIAKNLKSLVQLDIDAFHAYEQAISKIDILAVKKQLRSFRDDHRRHVENLSSFIKACGEPVPNFSPGIKGYMIQGFTALRSITGTEGALKAMQGNEELTNRTYENALSWELPTNIREVVKLNRDDERRHLDYIEDAIANRVWEERHVSSVTPMRSTSHRSKFNKNEAKLDSLEEEIDQEIAEGEIVEKRKRSA